MKKARILKITDFDGKVSYEIQQRHFLWKWLWVNACENFPEGVSGPTWFDDYEKAKEHLIYFNGTKKMKEVMPD